MSRKIDFEALEATTDIEYLVCYIGLLWRRLINSKIKPLGISGTEKRVLFCILRNSGLNQVQMATLLDLEPQNLMRSLDRLEKNGWIERQTDAKDRRVKCPYLTVAGKKIISKIQSLSNQLKPHILANMDEKNIQYVVKYLAQMRENIN